MLAITWNIQWGRGVDGRVDLERIVATARAMGDFDLLCLQEVADNYPGLQGAAPGDNQFARLAQLLPGYHATEGIAVERHTPGLGRQRFGNMIFSRTPPLQVLRHQLPWPADPLVASMPRMALEIVIDSAAGPMRVITAHLEYYSLRQRTAQLEALRGLQSEAAGHAADPAWPERQGQPFETRAREGRALLCGDFNCDARDPLLARLQQGLAGAPAWMDAWKLANPGQRHPTTVGLYDDDQWKGEHQCFDFFFVSSDLAGSVRRVAVDSATQASDHQPLLIEIDLARQMR